MPKTICFILLFSVLCHISCDEHPLQYKRIEYLGYRVRYEATGDLDTLLIRYVDENGSYTRLDTTSLPFVYEFDKIDDFYAELTASSLGQSGSIIASIYTNDKLFLSDSMRSPNPLVVVNGTIRGLSFSTIVTETR